MKDVPEGHKGPVFSTWDEAVRYFRQNPQADAEDFAAGLYHIQPRDPFKVGHVDRFFKSVQRLYVRNCRHATIEEFVEHGRKTKVSSLLCGRA